MPSQLMRAIYYRAADGSEPVRDFVDGLPIRCRVLLDNQVDLLNRLTIGALDSNESSIATTRTTAEPALMVA
jgi:hypothetical protein